ncbi:unnamed protein product [Cyclocybe aegerita]|uniref:FAD linked oxidase N-terminal domain-containing protein n=1 Tax=Cyclocybe aegerita TaxID=1973307 RepID=A0A8S0W4L7_CYCAE|nr:unnamed protein product [Cyclocybe aegerita]
MIASSLVGAALALLTLPLNVHATPSTGLAPATRDPVCLWISHLISPASNVYYPGEELYDKGVQHGPLLPPRSRSERIRSLAQPQVFVNNWRAMHISTYRFNDVKYDATTETVEVGAGLVWDDVYRALEPHGVNVVGARVPDVGVAGLTLGGGKCSPEAS